MECCFGEQMHHTLGSPLLLCDSCPHAVHMACLELDYAALPPGDWACPECTEKGAKAANQFRRERPGARDIAAAPALEQVPHGCNNSE